MRCNIRRLGIGGVCLIIPLGIRLKARNILEPRARGLSACRISPNALTLIGLLPAVGAGVAFAVGTVRFGGVLVGISGVFDLLDGLVARVGNKQTAFGALLDSTLDRFAEIAIFIGLAVLFRGTATLYGVMLALGGSLMVSYVKARAEGLGSVCDGGMLQRPERLIIILLGALLGIGFLKWAIWIIAVLGNITAIERLLRVRRGMHAAGH
jgi:CDP-diacylglycerol--glycerol-3-phosphate 3-phosphatidyltransferase